MAQVRFDAATCVHGGLSHPTVDKLDLEVRDGEFLVLVGPSGCGKSTTLRMLAGLETVTSGSIHIGARDVTDLEPRDRDIAMVFQSYALYPHMTVADNIGFHLEVKGMPKAERQRRIHDAAEILELTALLDRKPAKLSGGQRQRVAMGRAIVRQPQVFLMDEPLSNLDAHLRVQTRAQISALQHRLKVTTVYVTHDQVEAMTMGDRIAILKDGVLQQCASPRELFTRPVNRFVAGFIGSPAMNLLEARIEGNAARVGQWSVPLTTDQLAACTTVAITIGLRPENWNINLDGGAQVRIESVEEMGSDAFLYCRHEGAIADGMPALSVRCAGLSDYSRGDTVWLAPQLQALHLFDTATGARLPDVVA